jgi:hypothetical protein
MQIRAAARSWHLRLRAALTEALTPAAGHYRQSVKAPLLERRLAVRNLSLIHQTCEICERNAVVSDRLSYTWAG